MTPEEQTCQPVRIALIHRQLDEALAAVWRARSQSNDSPAPGSVQQALLAAISKSDEDVARAVAELTAQRASSSDEVNVRLLRKSIYGREEPLSRKEAWDFLNKGQRLSEPVAWEKLHAGWDLNPTMSRTQTGAHATLSFRDEAGQDHQFRADPKSPLSTLWLWANFLFMSYNWPRSQAAWFLLTGDPPVLMPMVLSGSEGLAGPMTSTITVTVPAYVEGNLVATALAVAQRSLLGRRNGPLALARHAMTEFADQQFENQAERPGWPEVWRRWNEFAPARWRLRDRRLRYRDWREMLDAYRREKAARLQVKQRRAVALEKLARRRYGKGPRPPASS